MGGRQDGRFLDQFMPHQLGEVPADVFDVSRLLGFLPVSLAAIFGEEPESGAEG